MTMICGHISVGRIKSFSIFQRRRAYGTAVPAFLDTFGKEDGAQHIVLVLNAVNDDDGRRLRDW